MAIKVNSVSYVNKSDVFEGLKLAHNHFCDDFCGPSWGDAYFTLHPMKPIKKHVRELTEELAILDEYKEEKELLKEYDILFDRIKNLPDDLYFNFEG